MASQTGRAIKRLFVGNLPWTVGHQQLGEYFSQFGRVFNSRVIFDPASGMSKGYGFIDFTDRKGYDDATNKQIHTLEGHTLSVQPATEK